MLETLKKRFDENSLRHPGIDWQDVEKRLSDKPEALEIMKRMEETGGEPDVLGADESTGEIIFCDCSKETPAGRRSLCYDDEALLKRKKNPPAGSAMHQAQEMGVELMTEELYRKLQDPCICSVQLLILVDSHSGGNKEARRSAVRRTPLRSRVHLPQRRGFILFDPRLERRAEGVKKIRK